MIGALLVNFGSVLAICGPGRMLVLTVTRTITDKDGMLVAGQSFDLITATHADSLGREANVNKKPLVFDPVAIGATSFRRTTSKGGLTSVSSELIPQNCSRTGSQP